MNRYKNKVIFFSVFLFLLLGIQTSAQLFMESGINIGAKVGGAKLISEYTSSFESIKEFTNKPGVATGIEISKVLFPHFELGAGFNYSILNGETDQTDHFSAIGFHAAFMQPITGSTEYNNKLIGPELFLRYYFGEAMNNKAFNPFLKAGFGFLSYKSTFKYVDTQEVIFGKGSENQADLSTGMLSLGTGIKTSLSRQTYLVTSLDFNMVKYDFLDVVHNYDSSGNRINITGLYSEIKIGIFFNSSQAGNNSGSKSKKGKKGKRSNNSNLPFAR